MRNTFLQEINHKQTTTQELRAEIFIEKYQYF